MVERAKNGGNECEALRMFVARRLSERRFGKSRPSIPTPFWRPEALVWRMHEELARESPMYAETQPIVDN